MAAIKTVEVRAEARVPRIEVSGGLPGSPGIPGNDGISVTGASIDGSGHLILSFSSGPDVDVGLVVGTNGTDGTDGVDGISITGASIDGSGHLILTFSSGPPVDVGDVTGTDGTNGADGVSIIGASVDGSYHLILTLSDSSTIDAGYVRGPTGSGTGDVVGPAGATNGNLASYNGTTGKLIGEIAPAALPISTATQTALDLKLNIGLDDATSGVDFLIGKNPLGAPVQLRIPEEVVTRHGASGDAAEDATAFFNAAKTKLRSYGGGALIIPAAPTGGGYSIDSFHWDFIAGGYGRLHLIGDGVASLIKKRVDDDQPFFIIGRNSGTQTYQGAVFLENLAIDGVIGGDEPVIDLWSLTTFKMTNVRSRYGGRAWRLRNCVTGTLENCQGSDSKRGLDLGMFTFPDATFSACNLINLFGGAYKDNSEWGIVQSGGSQLVGIGIQVEYNGTPATASGGVYVSPTAGELGTSRKFRAYTSIASWYENNRGYAAVALDGGASLFEGGGFVANNDADWDLATNGGLYTLVEVSMVNPKTNGNIKDEINAPVGSKIIGGQIVGYESTDPAKTDLENVNTGSDATPVRITRRKGRADVQAGSTDQKFIQAGLASGTNGSTVTFPTAFGATPRVIASINGNDATKVINVKVYNVTTTGFQFEKTEIVNGGGGAVVASATGTAFSWLAIGNTP